MAQLETTGPGPATHAGISTVRPAPTARPANDLRTWGPKVAVVATLVLGGVLAYVLPAVGLEGGGSLGLDEVGTKLTLTGDGWVVTLGWFGCIVGIVAALAFPRTERFIQSLAITAFALVAMVLPYFVATHLSQVDKAAVSLGSGLLLGWVCFGVAAALPWLGLLWRDRSQPVLDRDWAKWLFLLPAVVWVFLLTLFPLVYAFTTSRYAFRSGRISRSVGWDNYQRLFIEGTLWPAFGGALVAAAAAAGVVLGGGLLLAWLSDREITREDVRSVAQFVPLFAVPAALIYLASNILRDPLGTQLNITFFFVAGAVVTEMILGFLIALLMNRELRGRNVLRATMTLPIFATPIAMGYLGRAIFYETGGPINAGLGGLGLGQPPWLSDPQWARIATIIIDVWQWTPFVFIIALAGLQGLPQDVLEAAAVDGGGGWQALRHIILPLMAPILWLIFLLRAIDSFKVFDIAQGLTLGGPGRSTEYYSLFNYRTARQFFNYGEAAAQAFLLLLIVMLLVSLLWGRIRHVYEDDEVRA